MMVTTRLGLAALAALLGAATGCNQILGTSPPIPLGTDGGTAPCGDAEWTHWSPTASHDYEPHQGSDGNSYVTDALTGLSWQTPPPASESALNVNDANAYCQGLTWGDLKGYRLPTMVELASLTRYDLPAPALDSTAFPGITGDFWTSTLDTAFESEAFVVSYGDGRIGARATTATAAVWCVHDDKPAPDTECVRYTFDDDQASVRDIETQLVWQRAQSSGMKSWADAKDACLALGIGNHAWRLPQVSELITLLDVTGSIPSGLDPQFFDAGEPGTYYWSATADAIGPDTGAWHVFMSSGATAPGTNDQKFYVRCVR